MRECSLRGERPAPIGFLCRLLAAVASAPHLLLSGRAVPTARRSRTSQPLSLGRISRPTCARSPVTRTQVGRTRCRSRQIVAHRPVRRGSFGALVGRPNPRRSAWATPLMPLTAGQPRLGPVDACHQQSQLQELRPCAKSRSERAVSGCFRVQSPASRSVFDVSPRRLTLHQLPEQTLHKIR
jgi:hypothetical protein